MSSSNSRVNALFPPPRFNNIPGGLSRLQADLVSEALRRAVDDVSAAMAHQLGEPLTALLLYLHEIKQAGERNDGPDGIPGSMCQVVDLALRETRRVCEIIECIGQTGDMPIDSEAAVSRGYEAIEAWAQNGRARNDGSVSRTHPVADLHPLTPREREVLVLITGGCSNKEGGRRLGISPRTFEAHRAHLMGKLGAKNVTDLVRMTLGRDGE
jgi:DNA-binding CsgD family transcriptional regulator